jgi:hypothetical protein
MVPLPCVSPVSLQWIPIGQAMHALVRYLMIASLVVAAGSWWMKDALPPPAALAADVLEQPKQVRTAKPAIDTTVNGIDYRIQPRFAYNLSGLVVSLHHSDSWWDYAHKEWGDHINLMDLCVVWGGTAEAGAYKKVSFSNNQWECHWSWSSAAAGRNFNHQEVSNNHIVTDNPAVAKVLRKIRIGDQIRISGYLVDYTIANRQGARVTSTTRTDTGNGACEVLYVEAVELLGSAGRHWRSAQNAALIALLLSLIGWLFLPPRLDR